MAGSDFGSDSFRLGFAPAHPVWLGPAPEALSGRLRRPSSMVLQLRFCPGGLGRCSQGAEDGGARWKLAIVANSTLAVCMVLLYLALGTLSKSQLKEAFLVHLVADLGPVAYASYRFML